MPEKWLTRIGNDAESQDSSEFFETMKSDLFNDEVYVFTPKGDIINLKNGSTPIDFAYELHTDVGDKAIACKINRPRSIKCKIRKWTVN